MQCGAPSITTTIGAEAMQFNKPWPGSIKDDYEGLTTALLDLYDNAAHWEEKQSHIPLLVNEHFQYLNYLDILKKELPGWFKNIHINRTKNITGEILWHHSMRSTEFMSRWIMEKNK